MAIRIVTILFLVLLALTSPLVIGRKFAGASCKPGDCTPKSGDTSGACRCIKSICNYKCMLAYEARSTRRKTPIKKRISNGLKKLGFKKTSGLKKKKTKSI
eukprot:175671_1